MFFGTNSIRRLLRIQTFGSLAPASSFSWHLSTVIFSLFLCRSWGLKSWNCPTGTNFDAWSHNCVRIDLKDCADLDRCKVQSESHLKKRALLIHGVPVVGKSDFSLPLSSEWDQDEEEWQPLSRQKRKIIKGRVLFPIRTTKRQTITTTKNENRVKTTHKPKSLKPGPANELAIKSPNRPWGTWRDGIYVPYLILKEIHNGTCQCFPEEESSRLSWPWPEDCIITTTTIPSTSTANDEELTETDGEEGISEKVNYGRKAGILKPEDIHRKKVHFLSDDHDAGAREEEKIQKKIGVYDPKKVFTQKPNTVVSGHDESVEMVTEQDGPLWYTRIIKSRNRALKPPEFVKVAAKMTAK